jgi:hypothetical protein
VTGLAAPCGRQPAPPIKVAFIGGLPGRISELAIGRLPSPGTWPALQQPMVLDRLGDHLGRFHLGDVRTGRFVIPAT